MLFQNVKLKYGCLYMHSLKKPGEKCISITVNSIWIALHKRRFELYLKLAHALWIDKLENVMLFPFILFRGPFFKNILNCHIY